MKEILKFPSGWLFQQPEIQKMMSDSKGDKPLEPLEPKPFELNEQ